MAVTVAIIMAVAVAIIIAVAVAIPMAVAVAIIMAVAVAVPMAMTMAMAMAVAMTMAGAMAVAPREFEERGPTCTLVGLLCNVTSPFEAYVYEVTKQVMRITMKKGRCT